MVDDGQKLFRNSTNLSKYAGREKCCKILKYPSMIDEKETLFKSLSSRSKNVNWGSGRRYKKRYPGK